MARTATWVLVGLVGCSDPGPGAAPSAASSPAAPAPVAASAIASHAPGTVAKLAPKPPPHVEGDPPPLVDPPEVRRLETEAARSTERAGLAGWLGGDRVAIVEPGALAVVPIGRGPAHLVRTGGRVVAWDSAGERLAVLDGAGRTSIWDTSAGALVRVVAGAAVAPGDAPLLVLSRDGRLVARASTTISIHDVGSGAPLRDLPVDGPIFGLAIVDGVVGAVTGGTSVKRWAMDGGAELADQPFATGGTFGIAISPDARFGAGAAPDGHGLQVADLRDKGSLRQLVDGTTCDAHIGPAFSRDGRFVYAVAGRKWIKGFETGSFRPYASFHAPPGRAIESFADDLSRVLVTRDDVEPTVVLTSNARETPLQDLPAAPVSFSMSEDGRHVLGQGDGWAIVWASTTGEIVHRFGRPPP